MRTWGTACFVGEGGNVALEVSPDLLRRQVTLVGSWTFSTVGQKACNDFVADEPDEPSKGKPAKVADWLGIEQAMDRLVASDYRAEQDNKNNENACQVFDATEPVGKRFGWLAPRQDKRDPQRNCGRGVGNVVDHIGE